MPVVKVEEIQGVTANWNIVRPKPPILPIADCKLEHCALKILSPPAVPERDHGWMGQPLPQSMARQSAFLLLWRRVPSFRGCTSHFRTRIKRLFLGKSHPQPKLCCPRRWFDQAYASVCGQMYQHWHRSTHEFLFIINNDVLVPDGVFNRLMHTMHEAGSPHWLAGLPTRRP